MTRSSRWLAGTRANKHQPLARRPHASDYAPPSTHQVALCWVSPWPGESGFRCACGVAFDGFDSLAEAQACHRPGRPHHADRAVSIGACFPGGMPDVFVNPASVVAGARGRAAAPISQRSTTARSAAYHRQNGTVRLTPRQLRRMEQKYRRTLRPYGGAA